MSIDKHIDIMRDVYMTRAQREAYEQLLAQRDELLAICQELAESAAYWSEYDVPLGIVDRLNTAIAKAEGGGA